MGVTVHDAIVVSAFRPEYAAAGHAKAVALGLQCSEILISSANSWHTFLIAPDGSKEWWDESDRADKARAEWIAWAREQWAKDVYLYFAHVRFGMDMREGELVTTDDPPPAPPPPTR